MIGIVVVYQLRVVRFVPFDWVSAIAFSLFQMIIIYRYIVLFFIAIVASKDSKEKKATKSKVNMNGGDNNVFLGSSPGGWAHAGKAASYPINKGSSLRYSGYGKIFENPSILPVFYGSGSFWDDMTAGVLARAFPYLSSNSYFSNVYDLMNQRVNNASFEMLKPIYYYGPRTLNSQLRQNNVVKLVISDLNVSKSIDAENTFLILLLDPIYSTKSNFKFNNIASYDSKEGFCGFHSSLQAPFGGFKYPFAFVGSGGKNCQWTFKSGLELPNSGWNDTVMSVFIHEIEEMLTNPVGGGFVDDRGLEIGDKCVGFMGGFSYIGTSRRIYNIILGNEFFLIQAQFDPKTDSCPDLIYEN